MFNRLDSVYFPIVIFIIAALVRVLFLGDIPAGLNHDEAFSGYNAWALLHEGIDQAGNSWPLYFIRPGVGQSVLYSYLSMPFVAAMGLNVTSIRLLVACMGILSLWLFWRIGKKISPEMGVWALLVIATSPWHIMASRWAIEPNILPAIVLIATYGFIRARDNIMWLPLSSAVLATSVYGYDTAYLFTPLFLLSAWLILCTQKTFSLMSLLISGLCAAIIALPIIIFTINNSVGTASLHWGPISLPIDANAAHYSNIFIPLATDGITQLQNNIIQVLRLLLAGQDDGLPWNASPLWGPEFWILTPFLILGIAFTIRESAVIDRLMLAWFLCALVTAFFTVASIDRISLIWLPSLWLSGRGLWLFHNQILFNRLAKFTLCCFGIFFTVHYFTSQQEKISSSFSPGLGAAINAIRQQAPDDAIITITNKSVYTSVLFFVQPLPSTYLATAIISKYPYQTLAGFGRIRFGINNNEIANNNYWVAHISELANFSLLNYNIQTFGNYAAVTRKPANELACYQSLPLWGFNGYQDYNSIAINREIDGSTDGLSIADQIFPSGFGIHGDSSWTLVLDSAAENLQFGIGLSSSSYCSDGITFEILLDDKTAYISPTMKPGQLRFDLLNLQHATKITFVTKAGASNRCDHGLWLTPIIKRCQH